MERGFRIAGTLNEFIQDLENLKDKDHALTVWQNNAKGEKLIVQGKYDSFVKDKDNTIINIRLEKNETFEKDNPVYIMEKTGGILFKGRYEFCVNALLKILADDKVFLKEKRSETRFYFNHTSVKTTIESSHPDDAKTKLSDEVELRDVCSGGFSFKAKFKRSKLFNVKDEVELIKIGDIVLPRSIKGKIAHISPFKDLEVKGNKDKVSLIGVSFERPSKLFKKVIEALKD